MSFIDKLKDFMAFSDNLDEYDESAYDEDIPITPKKNAGAHRDFGEDAASDTAKKNRVVNINATTQLQVVLVKPERYEDARDVADSLNAKKTVVLNLESTNKDISRRLIDFLSGVAYANSGQIRRVANSTFIITPYNVDLVGDILEELENTGAFY
ncbi:MAG: cell division protein SepF [Oscillospiraceae bacterium]|jgi:cell division inhibitor SepF|nr:cell division protein SepF [Oscillospiraceae bacterium]